VGGLGFWRRARFPGRKSEGDQREGKRELKGARGGGLRGSARNQDGLGIWGGGAREGRIYRRHVTLDGLGGTYL